MLKKIVVASVVVGFLMGQAMLSANAQTKPEDWPDKIKLGLIPTMGRDVGKYYQPLTEHLRKELGIAVKVLSAKDYEGILTGISHDQIDVARLGAKSYVDAQKRYGVVPLAVELNKKGEPGYYGAFIAKKGSGIENMEQAKGKVFAFTDPHSTSGYFLPSIVLSRDFKIDPKTYFKEIKLSGSHVNSILGVKKGTIDVAAISEPQIYRLEEKGALSRDDFFILRRSELIPGICMAARKGLPESLRDALKIALIKFSDDKEGCRKIDIGGFQPADDKMYDIIRELKRLKKEMKKQK